jgi:hypothetical protein
MPSPESSSDDLIDLEEAAKRLGLRPDFLRWALEAGLLLGIKGQYGDWQLCLGNADAGPAPPLTGSSTPSPPAPMASPDEAMTHGRDISATPAGEVEMPPAIDEIAEPVAPAAEPSCAPDTRPPPPDANGSKVAAVLRDQIEFLRGQMAERDRTIAEKDATIADMAARCVELGSRAIARIPVEGAQRAYRPAPRPSISETAESAERQERINERHEQAIANVRDTLLMVRNYLAQLQASDPKVGLAGRCDSTRVENALIAQV